MRIAHWVGFAQIWRHNIAYIYHIKLVVESLAWSTTTQRNISSIIICNHGITGTCMNVIPRPSIYAQPSETINIFRQIVVWLAIIGLVRIGNLLREVRIDERSFLTRRGIRITCLYFRIAPMGAPTIAYFFLRRRTIMLSVRLLPRVFAPFVGLPHGLTGCWLPKSCLRRRRAGGRPGSLQRRVRSGVFHASA